MAPTRHPPAKAAIPLALYLHLPWCIRKCPYCDFNSHQAAAQLPADEYVEALLRDLDYDIARLATRERPLVSIFIGGGTPSLFPPAAISKLLRGVAERHAMADDIEITLEANPGAADSARFSGYLDAGVNRLSIGIQSFRNDMLARLGRVHDADGAHAAIEAARAAGFDNFNLDLMFGLPQDDIAGGLSDLTTAIAANPAHLSWYQLTLEPNTAFERNPPPLPDDDVIAEMQQAGQAALAEAGYQQYEISAYARAGRRARHNLNYWTFGDYLGIGAGAHGKITRADFSILRTARRANPLSYIKVAGSEDALTEQLIVADDERMLEFVLNGLRLNEGFGLRDFESITGMPRDTLLARAAKAIAQDMLEVSTDHLRPTARGRRFLNDVLLEFVPEQRAATSGVREV